MVDVDARLAAFGDSLGKRRDEWVRLRAGTGVDRRWSEDEDQYNGKDSANKAASEMMTSVEQGFPVTSQAAKPNRSTVYINITRQKTNAAEARLADILLPTDDRNWGIQPTPDPFVASMAGSEQGAIDPMTQQPVVGPDGQPVPMKELARAIMEEAQVAAELMQTEIEDQLTECDYNAENRKLIHNTALLGTGVIKGPITINQTRRAWRKKTDITGKSYYELQIVEDHRPASYSVDPRNCFPDPACGDNIHNGRGIFERHEITSRQLRDLAKQPGYERGQLRKVLEEGPKAFVINEAGKEAEEISQSRDSYEMWEYWGEVEPEDLEAAGVEVGEHDLLKSISACVVMINNHIVKAYLNPLETGEIPYDFYVWERIPNSVWGYGVPFLMRSQQKVINAAWRQMMDNAGASSGPQIVLKPSLIQPANKVWELTSRKLWYATDDLDDVRKAFATFEFNNHQNELAGIIDMAMKLVDDETAVPAIMQGEMGAAPDTVGGMQMLMNSANVVLRRLVKQFDDMITKPHIGRYYEYNMLHNEDEEIKGDFSVDARGTSALMVRDIQNQALLNLLGMAADPVYGLYVNPKKLFERVLQAQHLDPAEIFKTDQEIEQILEQAKAQAEQGQQADPRVEAAQIRAQTEIQKAQVQNQGDMAELQARMQIAQENQAAKREEMAVQREIEMLKMANTQNMTLEQIKAKLAEVAIRERGRKELFSAEQRLKMQTGSGI